MNRSAFTYDPETREFRSAFAVESRRPVAESAPSPAGEEAAEAEERIPFEPRTGDAEEALEPSGKTGERHRSKRQIRKKRQRLVFYFWVTVGGGMLLWMLLIATGVLGGSGAVSGQRMDQMLDEDIGQLDRFISREPRR